MRRIPHERPSSSSSFFLWQLQFLVHVELWTCNRHEKLPQHKTTFQCFLLSHKEREREKNSFCKVFFSLLSLGFFTSSAFLSSLRWGNTVVCDWWAWRGEVGFGRFIRVFGRGADGWQLASPGILLPREAHHFMWPAFMIIVFTRILISPVSNASRTGLTKISGFYYRKSQCHRSWKSAVVKIIESKKRVRKTQDEKIFLPWLVFCQVRFDDELYGSRLCSCTVSSYLSVNSWSLIKPSQAKFSEILALGFDWEIYSTVEVALMSWCWSAGMSWWEPANRELLLLHIRSYLFTRVLHAIAGDERGCFETAANKSGTCREIGMGCRFLCYTCGRHGQHFIVIYEKKAYYYLLRNIKRPGQHFIIIWWSPPASIINVLSSYAPGPVAKPIFDIYLKFVNS